MATVAGVNRRGAILVEALGGVALLVSALTLGLEIIRRSQQELLLHHAAFWVARGALLAPQTPPAERVAHFFSQVYGNAAPGFARRVHADLEYFPRHVSARVYTHFSAWGGFAFFGRPKSGFEVTRRCRFAFSP